MNRSATTCAKCFVPSCKNTTTNSPHKLFVYVKETLKRRWCGEVNVEYKPERRLFCCEDHLDLEEDLENYQYYKLMNGRPILKSTAKLHRIQDFPPCSEDEPKTIVNESSYLKSLLLKPIESLSMQHTPEATYSYSSFCQACLSSDRILFSNEDCIDVYKNILNTTSNVFPQVYLCWECIAELKKIKQFKAKAEEAQRIITHHFRNKQTTLPKTLSRLIRTYTDSAIIITHKYVDDDDNKQKLVIKKEKDSNDEFSDHNTNDYCIKKIKKENVSETKTNKKNKASHYKIVFKSNSRNKVFRKKFSIEFDDWKKWWDVERNSEFYKSFKFKCKLCVHGFNCEEKLNGHIFKYHDESIGPHVCSICNTRFSTKSSLHAHTQVHTCAWECARCSFQCYTKRRLNAHIKTHSEVQCAHCDGQFKDLATFYDHFKTLHSVFVCDHCGKRCRSKHMLQKHMSRHVGVHSCASCARRYKSRAALRKHFAVKHALVRPEDAYCVLCDKQYDSEFVYRRHVQNSAAHAHERDKQVKKKFPCPECGNVYSRRAYMMNHYRHVHMNESKHHCSECDRHFLNRTRYVEHMKYNHEGVKKDKNKLCNICGRGFTDNRTLLNHIRTHSGERPYDCEYCPAKFTQKASMVSHVKYIHMKSKRRGQWQE